MEELDKTKLKNVLKVPPGGFRGKKIKELSPSQRFNVTQNKTKVPLGGFRGKKYENEKIYYSVTTFFNAFPKSLLPS
jgi:hypothetical protein